MELKDEEEILKSIIISFALDTFNSRNLAGITMVDKHHKLLLVDGFIVVCDQTPENRRNLKLRKLTIAKPQPINHTQYSTLQT